MFFGTRRDFYCPERIFISLSKDTDLFHSEKINFWDRKNHDAKRAIIPNSLTMTTWFLIYRCYSGQPETPNPSP
jgi:hypothetical protein